jgi:hypothetical protein
VRSNVLGVMEILDGPLERRSCGGEVVAVGERDMTLWR